MRTGRYLFLRSLVGRMPVPGFLSTHGSNVGASQGADEDLLSFYSTTASTTWKAPRLDSPHRTIAPGNTGTGYVKNFATLEPPRAASHDGDRFQSTYKRLHTEANTVMRHNAEADPRDMTESQQAVGGFTTATCPSPIKWREESYMRQNLVLSPYLLNQRVKANPTEYENEGWGPNLYSTTFQSALPHPRSIQVRQQQDRGPPTSTSFRTETVRSGWKENDPGRPHPWEHPGTVPTSSTYRETMKMPMEMHPVLQSKTTAARSGLSRSIKTVLLGRTKPRAVDSLSTTHLSYIQGRQSDLTAAEVAPPRNGGQLCSTGFMQNIPHPESVIPKRRLAQLDRPDPADWTTSTASAHMHPRSFITNTDMYGRVLKVASGIPSSFGRAVVPLDRFEDVESLSQDQLHPTVAKVRGQRDPLFYNTRTFKI
mmetsp:Transcript_50211/g.118816  ORF Transcript_50211/g.118816 Transcript_50211/m.118816 type:complete len:425 (+) Transcript_50211:2-1276(+)